MVGWLPGWLATTLLCHAVPHCAMPYHNMPCCAMPCYVLLQSEGHIERKKAAKARQAAIATASSSRRGG